MKILRTIDLFAGVGGIRTGLEQTGFFRTVWANDFEPLCKPTYDLNSPSIKLTVGDITEIKTEQIPEFEFLVGGFPCQAFSVAGYRQGFDDEKGRGNLFFEIARILKDRKPDGFLLENVKNLQTHDKGNTFKVITQTLEDLGYHIKFQVLNSMDYGNVPQNRERIYIVGFKNRLHADNFKFPEKIPLNQNIRSVLSKEIPEKYYYNNKPLFERIKDEIVGENTAYQWRRQYVRENKKGVFPTLTANMGTGGHNVPLILDDKGIRKITPRECFAVQGFPDSFTLPNISDSALYKQAGNSVSVPVIKRIAENIIKAMELNK